MPKRSDLPFVGIDVKEIPRFKIRFWNSDTGHWALKKYQSRFWTARDWLRQFDWVEKRKMNMTLMPLGANADLCSRAIKTAFEIEDPPVGSRYLGGYPAGWAWPGEYRDFVTQAAFKFARERGIKFWAGAGYGDVPARFRTLHPELKYLKPDAYDNPLLHPDDSAADKYSKRYAEEMNKDFGTDHIYGLSMYCEALPLDSYDESLQLKIAAVKKGADLFRKFDPQARFLLDTWDFLANGGTIWADQNRTWTFLNALPKDDMYVLYDCTFDMAGPQKMYQRFNHFKPVPWAIGIVQSFAGDDHLHGDIARTIREVQIAADDPQSDNLVGMFLVPELTNAQVMFWHLVAEMAWNPKGITEESFVRDYSLHRYGRESLEKMCEASSWVVKGCYSNSYGSPNQQYPQQNKPYYKYREVAFSYPDQDFVIKSIECFRHLAGFTRKGIDLALEEKDKQKDNPLYVNDMLYYTKQYVSFLFNINFFEMHKAYNEGDKVAFETSVSKARLCLSLIEKMLSTRSDHSLKVMIDEVMSVPGTNPYTPEMIRQSCVINDYCLNDVYEIFGSCYSRIYDANVEALRKKLQSGIHDDDFDACADAKARIYKEWISRPVPESNPEDGFQGSTLESVVWALDNAPGLN
jgi:alpha-N-acetylglucosaminidase